MFDFPLTPPQPWHYFCHCRFWAANFSLSIKPTETVFITSKNWIGFELKLDIFPALIYLSSHVAVCS
jgi:hypothetical protein